ncbi:MAG: winged helix-turn-helix domain-containing protein [Acidobacteria bacterium]|nr:winged helix-turn-helix domain-containing protein [Acidobacteriota bacterium]
MSINASSSRMIRFGVFEADLVSCELRKHGIRLRLSEQPFQILAILLGKPGQIVTRDELRTSLWHRDTFVDFDHGLNNAIMRLREVLGDSSENPRYVETIPKRGYRFISPVAEIVSDATTAEVLTSSAAAQNSAAIPSVLEPDFSNRQNPQDLHRTWFTVPRVATITVLLVLGVTATVRYIQGVNGGAIVTEKSTSLVVLPLENLSGDKDQDYFADGMTDDLIANLAKIRSLRVISRSTAMAYKGTRKPLSSIAAELKVDAVVEGTVMRVGNNVRITAELVQVSTDHHLWADTYESPMGDVLALQNKVSSAIVDEIRINLTPEEKERLAKNPAISPEAYENYLKGRYYWNKRSEEGLKKGIEYFQRATEKDPHYALAFAGLADCYSIIGSAIIGSVPSLEVAPKAKAAALKALELDKSLAEAQTSLATVSFNYDWDWAGAASGFQRSIELNPNYATAYQRYSLYLMAMGRPQQSLVQMNRARDLEPLSISTNFSLGWRLYMAHQYDQAIEQLHNTLEMDPNFALPRMVLGQAYAQKGAFAQSITELQKAASFSRNSPPMLGALGHALAAMGNRAEAERVLAQLHELSKKQYVSPFYIATIYAGMHENEKALDCLDKAYTDRSNAIIFLRVDPEFDALRSNPRFQSLLHRLNL